MDESLRRLEIDVVIDGSGRIVAHGRARYGMPYADAKDLGSVWYQLGPEDRLYDGSVPEDRLCEIIRDLICDFPRPAIEGEAL